MNAPQVKCYSGHTYAERPESFRWRGVEYRVVAVERAWRQPGLSCFRVRTEDGGRFRLCYNEAAGQWSVTELVRSG